jgi:hypothetical protein
MVDFSQFYQFMIRNPVALEFRLPVLPSHSLLPESIAMPLSILGVSLKPNKGYSSRLHSIEPIVHPELNHHRRRSQNLHP